MPDIDTAIEEWKQLLHDAQEKYLADARKALAVHYDRGRPETQVAQKSYEYMIQVMKGKGLRLPKGYHFQGETPLPYAKESNE